MKCSRNEFVDCYAVKTQDQANKCLLPNQGGAPYSCQAQGDKPIVETSLRASPSVRADAEETKREMGR